MAFNRLVEQGNCDSIIQSSEQLLMSSTVEVLQFFFILLTDFDCRNTSTYYFVEGVNSLLDPERCTDLLTPEQTSKSIFLS